MEKVGKIPREKVDLIEREKRKTEKRLPSVSFVPASVPCISSSILGNREKEKNQSKDKFGGDEDSGYRFG
ncbi:unnamed protein product [Dovyalis caffra]|uniref:Uncharacterized protein n=1 Tax=Dovyalis caffra TaxID=77055 RepID=A0AAV1SRI3_9ROSI|nr:unnamed protein product [Dovyalis caffra]